MLRCRYILLSYDSQEEHQYLMRYKLIIRSRMTDDDDDVNSTRDTIKNIFGNIYTYGGEKFKFLEIKTN